MEYSGLIQKYKLNRPLSDEERGVQLRQKHRFIAVPVLGCAPIKLNSTFIEIADKWLLFRGFATVVMLLFITIALYGLLGMFYDSLSGVAPSLTENWPVLLGLTAMFVPLLWFMFWLLRKESFAYTHYPIRLNRKNRKVYVFQPNGTVLTAKWDDLFFCFGRCTTKGYWDIRAHVLDADGQTVRDTFALPPYTKGLKHQLVTDQAVITVPSDAEAYWRYCYSDKNPPHSTWEFYRRYMEDGPQAVRPYVYYARALDKQRETLREAYEFLAGGLKNILLEIFYFPWLAVIALGRWIADRTSKIPQWPQWVEDECAIDADDPYRMDGRSHPPPQGRETPETRAQREADEARQKRELATELSNYLLRQAGSGAHTPAARKFQAQ